MEKIKEMWQKMTTVQKINTIVAIISVVVAIISAIIFTIQANEAMDSAQKAFEQIGTY